MQRSIRIAYACALLLACQALSGNEVGSRPTSADIARFGHAPHFAHIRISPDGMRLSYVEQEAGRSVLLIRSVESDRTRRTLAVESRREQIRWCDWANRNFVLCGTAVPVRRPQGVAQKTRLYAIHAQTGAIRELNRRLEDPIRDRVIGMKRQDSDVVLLQHDPLGHGYPGVYELNVATGELRRLVRPQPPIRRWMTNHAGALALGIGFEESTATLHVRRSSESDEWRVVREQSLSDPEAIGPLAVGAANVVYALKHHEGRAALFRFDPTGSERLPELIHADRVYDVTGPVILDPKDGAPLSVQYVRELELQRPLDEGEAERLQWLQARLPDLATLIIDRSEDGRRLLVRAESDADPPSFYVFDDEQRTLKLIGHAFPEIEASTLASMRSTHYPARDGQRIPAYLTLPTDGEARRLPVIVLPHGGPETRTWKRFDPLVQLLAAKGYTVFQMNFRGSFGYGAGFALAGAGQWGGVIHNDITDGTRWLIERGIADPTRICIVGASFGGYAALLGAARESEWYACAASFAGVSDLLALSQQTSGLFDADVWKQRLGGSSQALWQMSPLGRVHTVETPVLLMHGRLDVVVPSSQSRRFARELREAGKEHRFLSRTDCDHDMTIESCRIAFFENLADFLDEHLQ